MSDISTGAISHVRTSVVEQPAQQTNNKVAENLQQRKVYEGQNPNPRSQVDIALMQPRSEAATTMYARTVEAYGNDKGMPRAQGASNSQAGNVAGNSISNGSGFSASASADWSPVSLPMLKRIYGDKVAGKVAGKNADKVADKSAGKNTKAEKVKHLSTRTAENKTGTAGGSNVRFAGLKSLFKGLGARLSSLFTHVRSERAAAPRFLELSDKLKAKIKQHEELQTARHAKMSTHLKSRGDYDVRTQKFANVFAQRMEHFDSIASGFKQETLVTYKQIRKETEALLNASKGKVFTSDAKFHKMIGNLENINNLFFQDIDMAVFALKEMGK